MSIDTCYKAVAYSCLYKIQEAPYPNAISSDDISMTLVRSRYPARMFRDMEKSGIQHRQKYPGIYCLSGRTTFATQVIVTSELSDDEDLMWLKAMRKGLSKEAIDRLYRKAEQYGKNTKNRENAGLVLKIVEQANRETIEKEKETNTMFMELLNAKEAAEEAKKALKDAVSDEKKKNALSMLEDGLPVEKIEKYTGLNQKDILALKGTKSI